MQIKEELHVMWATKLEKERDYSSSYNKQPVLIL